MKAAKTYLMKREKCLRMGEKETNFFSSKKVIQELKQSVIAIVNSNDGLNILLGDCPMLNNFRTPAT